MQPTGPKGGAGPTVFHNLPPIYAWGRRRLRLCWTLRSEGGGSTEMWTRLSQDDLLKARDTLTRRQVEMATRHLQDMKALEDKHAEERDTLEAKLSHLAKVERLVGAFVEEYLETAPTDLPPEPPGEPEPKVQAAAAEPSAPKAVEVDATSWYRRRFRTA